MLRLRFSAALRFVSDTYDMSRNVVTSLLLLVLLGPDLNCAGCCHCSCTIEAAACEQELRCVSVSEQSVASITADCHDCCCHSTHCPTAHRLTSAAVVPTSIEESTVLEVDEWSTTDSSQNIVTATRICRSDSRPATFTESRLFVRLCSLWI